MSSFPIVFTPDFSSTSSFPRRSFEQQKKQPQQRGFAAVGGPTPTTIIASPPSPSKRVRFASCSSIQEFVIQPRHNQKMSISSEKILNRILQMKQLIDAEYKEIKELELIEAKLNSNLDTIIASNEEAVAIMHAKKIVAALRARTKHLEDSISTLRMDTFQIKGKCHQLVAKQKEMDLKKRSASFDNERCWLTKPTIDLAKSWWTRATTLSKSEQEPKDHGDECPSSSLQSPAPISLLSQESKPEAARCA